jgi:hypothetical protein
MAQYINRLKKRMLTRGFQPDDPLFAAVLNAERATHALLVQAELLAKPGPSNPIDSTVASRFESGRD